MTPGARTRVVRAGPVGRLVRLALAALLGFTVYGLVQNGLASFSDPEILNQPGFWALTIIAAYSAYDWPAQWFGPVWGRRVVAGLAALAAVAALIAGLDSGTPWAAPLTWLLYPLYLAIFATLTLALLTATVLGTPGCEMSAYRELAARLRGRYDAARTPVAPCVAGLHRLDAWEARQRWHHADHPVPSEPVNRPDARR